MGLKEYNQKRDFKKTSEPEGKEEKASGKLIFVVQRHAATRLHYDFRLEMEGVLKSWAVPKGPSLNPKDKRLAMMVEDHPYSYRTFEGTIPEGSYGGGEVEIWDDGTYEALEKEKGKSEEEVLLEGLKKGSLKVVLHGEKLKGEFALVKLKSADSENAWLLIKHNDKFAVAEPYDAESYTPEDSKVTAYAEKRYKNFKKKKTTKSTPRKRNFAPYLSGQKKLDKYIKPMLATLSDEPFDDDDWIFEIKWDGYRAIAEITDTFRLYSRNGLSFAGKYPPIEEALKKQEHEMILDGEIVAYNKENQPDFQTLQHFGDNPDAPLVYNVFDLLYLNGHNTTELTLIERKELLKEALIESNHLKYCDHVAGEGKAFFDQVTQANLEGMIAKKKSSLYHKGSRSKEWLKVKVERTEEAVIVGYTEPRGSRTGFGALLLGTYQKGELVYAGHTGTGFSDALLSEIYDLLQPLVTSEQPFKELPKTNMPATWVEPKLVCTIKYSERTADKMFRHPVFVGIRDDKSPEDLQRESLQKTVESDENNSKKENMKQKTSSAASAKKNNDSAQRKVKYTNLDKLYWEEEKITKGDLIEYYQQISDYILPYMKDRAQSLNRHPNGIESENFYHKDAGGEAPEWVDTTVVHSESSDKEIEYIVCNNKETLGYLNNLGCIELNPWNSRVKSPDYPDYLIIDLDPSRENSFEQVIEAAQTTKEVLDAYNIPSYCKTSGSTGLHIFVPMGAKYTYDQVKDFGHIIAQLVMQKLPDTTTLERTLKKRGGKIYLDYLQNRSGQTVASVYSVRPRPGAPVSMPLEWEEVKKGLHISDFTIHNALERIQKKGDIFAPVLGNGIDMEKALDLIQQ